MKIAIHVSRNAALRRGTDTYGWRVVDVPAAALTETDREFLISSCSFAPSGYDGPKADYIVGQILCKLGGSLEAPEAPEEINVQSVVSYIQKCQEMEKVAEAERTARDAAEDAEKAEANEMERRKNAELVTRILIGEFKDEQFRFDARSKFAEVQIAMPPDVNDLWLRCAYVDPVVQYVKAAIERAETKCAAEKAAKAEAEAAAEKKRRSAIEPLLRQYCAMNVIERFEAGLLPEKELDSHLTNIAHLNLKSEAQYELLEDICLEHIENCPSANSVKYTVEDEGIAVDGPTWDAAKKLKAKLPAGAESRIRRHWASCPFSADCGFVDRYSLQVRIVIPEVGAFAREYAV